MLGTVYLMYHELKLPGRKLCDGFIRHYRYAVAQSDFQQQIQYLQDYNWRAISVSEALADPQPAGSCVAITFDDGSETDLIGAAPLLKQSNFNATFYVVVGWLGRPSFLSSAQLRELADLGFEIGCHSMTHANLCELGPTQLYVEIADAKQKLEDILNKRVDHFSAPYGFWNQSLAQMAIDAGYRSVVTSRPGVNLRSADPFNLARVVMMHNTSVQDLERLCRGKHLLVRKAQEIALQVPKRLLGFSRYNKLGSLFSADVTTDRNSCQCSPVITSRSANEWIDHASPRQKALMINYNVGDGGSAYEVMVEDALAGSFHLSRHKLDFRRWGFLKYVAAPLEFVTLRRILTTCANHAVAVKTFSAALLNPRRQPPSIVLIHHLKASNNPLYSALEMYILEHIPRSNTIVVVSEYWKRYLLRQGFTNVHKIYNAFNLEEFDIADHEIENFRRRYNLLGKFIIYLGNHSPRKGVEETLETLKDLDVHLVASGNGRARGRMKCFHLARKDYICLLAASRVAITMSQFAEGWCRTTHEAMLCGTPVVGSGQGGMGELLDSGGQIICRDFASLRGTVEGLLANADRSAELGRKGREFARQFTRERFEAEWIDLVNKVCTGPSERPRSTQDTRLSNAYPGTKRSAAEATRRLRVHDTSRFFSEY
jgi:peptidoglycan/xylan/chitin deacetylase (PgdA/CDA1 family)/glycosyltransferase involved in cell wall biosynthesis